MDNGAFINGLRIMSNAAAEHKRKVEVLKNDMNQHAKLGEWEIQCRNIPPSVAEEFRLLGFTVNALNGVTTFSWKELK